MVDFSDLNSILGGVEDAMPASKGETKYITRLISALFKFLIKRGVMTSDEAQAMIVDARKVKK